MSKWEKIRSVHTNSVSAYYEGKLSNAFNMREQLIMGALRQLREATDREVMNFLGFTDTNSVRPRITELIKDAGILEQCGSIHCKLTDKRVRIVRIIPPGNHDGQLDLFN